MKANHSMKAVLLYASLFLASLTACQAETPVLAKAASFKPLLEFSRGSGTDQLLWLLEDDGSILPGAFKGPMVFRTDVEKIVWIGDTQNARISAYSVAGKCQKNIDLIATGKQLGLKKIPALLDMIFNAKGKLLVADAANNVIIEIEPATSECRCFMSPEDEDSAWMQINYIHTDSEAKIFIEDLALQRTVVLDENGQPFAAMDSQNCLATNIMTNRLYTLASNEQSPETFHILVRGSLEDSWRQFATIDAKNPITWVGILGLDGTENLTVVYETETARHYLAYSKDAALIKSLKTLHINPGYDPLYPDWVGSDGTIYSVCIDKDALRIMQLN